MKRNVVRIIGVSVGLTLLAGALWAQPQHRMAKARAEGPGMMMKLAEELELSDEQKSQIHQVFMDARKKNIDVRAKQEIGRIELHELLAADTPDQKKIDEKISAISNLHEQMMRNHVETLLAAQKILTPEQRKKAKDLHLFQRLHGGPGGDFDGPRHRMGHGFGFGMMDPGPDVPDGPEGPDEN